MSWQTEPGSPSTCFTQLGDRGATLDLQRPDLGLQIDASTSILQLRFDEASGEPEPMLDHYVRGQDLVATYTQSRSRKFRPQVYWRQVEAEAGNGFELIVSAQTSLLDADTEIQLSSHIAADSAMWFTDAEGWTTIDDEFTFSVDQTSGPAVAPLLWLQTSQRAYAEFLFPHDFHEVVVRKADSGWQTNWKLFDLNMEKGVIRRGRAAGILLPSEVEQSEAVTWRDRMLNLPLPLTT